MSACALDCAAGARVAVGHVRESVVYTEWYCLRWKRERMDVSMVRAGRCMPSLLRCVTVLKRAWL